MRKGFSLIEIIIAISIIAILFGFSISTLLGLSESISLSVAAREIATQLRLSQGLAQSMHKNHIIEFSKSSSKYSVLRREYDGRTEIYKTFNLPKGINFKEDKTFEFSASGFPLPSKFGTITIESFRGGKRSIIVSSVGRVRIQ